MQILDSRAVAPRHRHRVVALPLPASLGALPEVIPTGCAILTWIKMLPRERFHSYRIDESDSIAVMARLSSIRRA
jgi:hypothetical protein